MKQGGGEENDFGGKKKKKNQKRVGQRIESSRKSPSGARERGEGRKRLRFHQLP